MDADIEGIQAAQAAEYAARFRGLSALFHAIGSQIGAGGYEKTGAIIFMNADVVAEEVTQHSMQNPHLGMLADLICNAFLTITAGITDEYRSGPSDEVINSLFEENPVTGAMNVCPDCGQVHD